MLGKGRVRRGFSIRRMQGGGDFFLIGRVVGGRGAFRGRVLLWYGCFFIFFILVMEGLFFYFLYGEEVVFF